MQHVVEKAILLVPHSGAVATEMIDGIRDIQEVLPELAGHVFVSRIFTRQLHRDRQQVQTIHRHPTSAVGLLNMTSRWQGRAAVEDADVVEPEEPTLKHVAAFAIFAVYPPSEVQQQLLEDAGQEGT